VADRDHLLRHPGLPRVPAGWSLAAVRHLGPFVAGGRWRRADGSVVELGNRVHRKAGTELEAGGRIVEGRPSRVSRGLAVLFGVGSICFILGPLPGYVDLVGDTADAITYFVGSIFFTSAATLQWLEAASVGRQAGVPRQAGVRLGEPRRRFGFEPTRFDWWAAAIQLAGTLFFNISTFAAIHAADTTELVRRVWAPDAFGSIAFVVSSLIAYLEVAVQRPAPPRSRAERLGGRIAVANLVGSVLFGVSAVASYVLADTTTVWNAAVANAGTCGGGICFLWGAVLLPAESAAAAIVVAGLDAPAPSGAG
jgi:hypothetical protein